MTVAYLRVSTGHQLLDNQRNEIEKYAAANHIVIDKWVTEVVSGRTKGRDRKLGALVKKLHEGDTLIVTELSRLSRTLLDIVSIVTELLRKKVIIYSTKEGCKFDDSINGKVLLFAFGLVAEIERNMISMRTKEALALRKEMGVKLGRPAGSKTKFEILEKNKDEIVGMRKAGVSIARICETFGVSQSTWRRFWQSLPADLENH